MFSNQSRDQLRKFYFDVWRKHNAGQPLEPVEAMIADIIRQHPEYHGLLADEDTAIDRDYLPEADSTNPFLHMGLHAALREQVEAQRPPEAARVFQRLTQAGGDAHEAEHRMMECLAEALWQAQRAGTMPDESAYTECLEGLSPR